MTHGMCKMTMFEVGGAVRDRLLGLRSKDIDFAVEITPAEAFESAQDAFLFMVEQLTNMGFTIFKVVEDMFTVRARFPKGHVHEKLVADFVLCRIDGPSSDSRHPDWVQLGTLGDDQARRDFTINSMAVHPVTGELIDPWGGERDLANRRLRFVGDPRERLQQDALRALRALRFVVTKDLRMSESAILAIRDPFLVPLLARLPKERIREELDKAFAVDTLRTFDLLASMPRAFREVIFNDGLRLKATQES